MTIDSAGLFTEKGNSGQMPCDDILYGALRMYQPDEDSGPRVNVDTVLLSGFADARSGSRVIEMGCAHGAITLILAKRASDRGDLRKRFEGFDINPRLVEMAALNAELNALSDRVKFSVFDLRRYREFCSSESYDVVVMNPPYDEPGRCRPSPRAPISDAMHGESCTLAEVIDAAKYLLKNGGKFFMVMRANRSGELFALLEERNIRAKRVCFVHPRPERAASVVLVEAVRASGAGLVVEPPLYIYGSDGEYTERLLEVYRIGGTSCPS